MKIAVKNFDNKTGPGARAAGRGLRLPVQGAPHPRRGAGATWPAARAGTHKTKTRGEVSGSGKKLWKQKGTGRARMGSVRSPMWRHGGTVHGPVAARLRQGPLGAREEERAASRRCRARSRTRRSIVLESLERPSHRTGDLAEPARQARRRGQGAAGRPASTTRTSRSRRATTRRSRPSTLSASTSTTWSTAPSWWSASRRSGGWWRCSADENPGDHPAAADHREVERPARRHATCSRFEVDARANKIEIKRAVETQFKVKVAEVRVANCTARCAARAASPAGAPDWKKAYVRLAEGEKPIEFFEGA